jgi:hypothetical protein
MYKIIFRYDHDERVEIWYETDDEVQVVNKFIEFSKELEKQGDDCCSLELVMEVTRI